MNNDLFQIYVSTAERTIGRMSRSSSLKHMNSHFLLFRISYVHLVRFHGVTWTPKIQEKRTKPESQDAPNAFRMVLRIRTGVTCRL